MSGIKTLVELYDVCKVCNIISGYHFNTDKIIYLCFDNEITEGVCDARRFFKKYALDVKTEYIKVNRFDYEGMCATLERVVKENEDVVFDLTGGGELLLTAMGAVGEKFNIPMIQYNVKRCSLVRVKNTQDIQEPERKTLEIEGCIALNGGAVVGKEKTICPDNINKPFVNIIIMLWQICSGNPQEWNKQTNSFSRLERFTDNYDSLRITFDMSRFPEEDRKSLFNDRIIKRLIDIGVFSEFKTKGDIISYRYKNANIKRCILKAGNILELYTFIVACEVMKKCPEEINDVAAGVILDWDGEVHDVKKNVTDIRNEVDVMLAKGLNPVFVSCKNGEVHKEALYELDTVSDHYGGKYSGKILVSTYVSTDAGSRSYIIKRAEEMNIRTITDVDKMSYEEFYKKLRIALLGC